jgi:surface antigen
MRRHIKSFVSISTALVIALPAVSFNAQPAKADSWCWCTQYVANRFGLPGDFPDAGNWNDGYLQRNGFVQVNPQAGAIAVLERSFPGSDPTYGHVAIVESISPDGRVQLRGANQSVGGSIFGEAGCTDVRITSFATPVNGNPNISFWKRGSGGSTTGNIHTVNFSATAAPSGVNIRSAPSTSASLVGRFAPNQRINFDAWTYGDTVPDFWINTPDARWYRVAGTNNWVASAVVSGNAPGSTPRP